MAAVTVLADMLLDPAVTLGPFDSFPEFQELFPPKYRDHPDARLLYRAFQRHRRLLREKVAKDIRGRYKRSLQSGASQQRRHSASNQPLEQVVSFLEIKETEVEEELKVTREDIGGLEQEIQRFSSSFEQSSSIGQLTSDDLAQLKELQNLAATLSNKRYQDETR